MREPHYQRIKRHLLSMIEDGRLKPGDRVPAERELNARFGVSRMTARQALIDLERGGFIIRYQGRGSFVAEPKLEEALADLTSFTTDMTNRGFRPGGRLLRHELVTATESIAQALGLDPGDPVLRIERLRTANGVPVAVQVAHLPGRLDIEANEIEDGSLYAALRRRGLVPSAARETLEALLAGGADADRLGVREGAPLLGLTRLTSDQTGHPIEYTISRYRGDRYRFVVDLAHHEVGPRQVLDADGVSENGRSPLPTAE